MGNQAMNAIWMATSFALVLIGGIAAFVKKDVTVLIVFSLAGMCFVFGGIIGNLTDRIMSLENNMKANNKIIMKLAVEHEKRLKDAN